MTRQYRLVPLNDTDRRWLGSDIKRKIEIDITLRRLADGVERVVKYGTFVHGDTIEDALDSTAFMWLEGNYSCDCNRYLFFQRVERDPEEPDRPCSASKCERYAVVAPDWLADQP